MCLQRKDHKILAQCVKHTRTQQIKCTNLQQTDRERVIQRKREGAKTKQIIIFLKRKRQVGKCKVFLKVMVIKQ